MSPKVSIIVPIYNAGKFLEQCLDTLIYQTLKDIEIILVLDCPTDGSDRIAREYAEKDSRIKLIFNKHNLNIGLSRNEGLKIAQGEYVGFSDHDDWRELDMYEKLYREAQENKADIVISNYDCIFPDRTVKRPPYPKTITNEKLKQEIFNHLIGDWKKDKAWVPFTRAGAMWHMLYKREMLEKNNIQFPDNKATTFEDLFFLIQFFYVADKIAYFPQILYHHVYHQSNQESDYSYYSTPLIINYLIQLDHFLTINRIRDRYLRDYFSSAIHYLWRSLRNEIHHKSYRSAFFQLTEIRKNPNVRKLLEEIPFSIRMAKKLKIQKTILWLLLRC